jgi:hypothetical protein
MSEEQEREYLRRQGFSEEEIRLLQTPEDPIFTERMIRAEMGYPLKPSKPIGEE